MSIDPLAEKYAYNGVYNFSENRVIDGRELEGLEWVDNKNNIVYDPSINNGKGGFTSFATSEHKNLAKSLNQTTTGKSQFNTLVNSSYPIETIIDKTNAPKDSKGKLIFGSTVPDALIATDLSGKVDKESTTIKKSIITFFEVNIKLLDDALNDGKTNTGGNLYGTKLDEKFNFSDLIGIIFGHEIEHTKKENIIVEANGGNVEEKPTNISNQIIKETKENKQAQN